MITELRADLKIKAFELTALGASFEVRSLQVFILNISDDRNMQ